MRTRSKSRDSSSSGAAFTPASNGRLSYITDSSSAPSAGKEPPFSRPSFGNANPIAMTPNPTVAAWGGGFAPAPMPVTMAFTPLSSSIMPPQMTPASRYGYGPRGFHSGPQQPYQSTGWKAGEIGGDLPNAGSDQRHSQAEFK